MFYVADSDDFAITMSKTGKTTMRSRKASFPFNRVYLKV